MICRWRNRLHCFLFGHRITTRFRRGQREFYCDRCLDRHAPTLRSRWHEFRRCWREFWRLMGRSPFDDEDDEIPF
jgi:hypothetical protein